MLTGYQCEVVAFIGDGEFVCHDCAHKALDEGQFAQCERGLGNLSPVIRYSLDEYNGERVYEEATERVRDFLAAHPAIDGSANARPTGDGLGSKVRWGTIEQHLIERAVEKLGDTFNETCGECGEVIS